MAYAKKTALRQMLPERCGIKTGSLAVLIAGCGKAKRTRRVTSLWPHSIFSHPDFNRRLWYLTRIHRYAEPEFVVTQQPLFWLPTRVAG